MAYNSFAQQQNGLLPPPVPPLGLGVMGSAPQPPLPPYEGQHRMMGNQGQQQQPSLQQMNQMQQNTPSLQQRITLMQQQQQYQQQIQHMQHMSMMHPAMNDQPLEFNMNKNKPPISIVHEQPANGGEIQQRGDEVERRGEMRGRRPSRRGSRDRRDRERDRDSREHTSTDRDRERSRDRDSERDREHRDSDRKGKREIEVEKQVPPPPPLPPAMPNMPLMGLGGMMGGMMGGMGGVMPPPMVPMMGGMDPLMGLGQFGMVPGMMPPSEDSVGSLMGSDGPFPGQRSILEFKECSLVPPSPLAPMPITRERPPGCKTIYIGGLPENITGDIIKDVFGRCGDIVTIRLSRKNFCHIRFESESSVDAAMLLSGYRMRIGNNTDAANTGRLHVDYAQARVDQYEFECKQRALQREARHRERMERDRQRPASPPLTPQYTDHDASVIVENIKTDEGFKKSVATVVTWLERGDLSKKNANTFYAIIQSTSSHVRRLLNEKMQFEEELQTAKDLHRTRVHQILTQFEFIEKVFTCASHKKCWDHFTKAQRKSIESWKKQSAEMKQLQLVDVMNDEEGDDEMDVSDEDCDFGGPARKRPRTDVNALKDENDSLRCQLEAYKNEVDLVKLDVKADMDAKDHQIKVLQHTIQNMRNETLMNKSKLEDLAKRAKEGDGEGNEKEDKGEQPLAAADSTASQSHTPTSTPIISERDAKLIGLISTFLHVHPFGAGLDYVWSYLSKLDPSAKVLEVETLMLRFPTVFRQELSGIGASMERRWVFCGFEGTG